MIGVIVPAGLLGKVVDLGEVEISSAMIEAYARAVGDDETLAAGCNVAPPTFCLTLRRGFVPDLELPPGTFGVYGGHDIELGEALIPGDTCRITSRISDVYEKSGRSGAMTVVVREAEILRADGRLAARISERQIVRRIPGGA